MTETPNLGLSQWSFDDLIKMADFNSDNLKLDNFGRLNSGLGNEYVWKKTHGTIGMNDEQTITLGTSTVTNTIYYSSSAEVLNGAVSLVNPSSTNTATALIMNGSSALSGMYFRFANNYESYLANTVYYVPVGKTIFTANSIDFVNAKECFAVIENIGYVNSSDPNAYPLAVSDGYTYTALGQLGNKVRMATGSYVGTGTYGASNPNRLTLDFVPKYIRVFVVTIAGTAAVSIFAEGTAESGLIWGNGAGDMRKLTTTWGKTLSWYGASANYQLNDSEYKYYYVAIG